MFPRLCLICGCLALTPIGSIPCAAQEKKLLAENGWKIEKVSWSKVDGEVNVIGGSTFSAKSGQRLLRVTFTMTASKADPKAVEKLEAIRQRDKVEPIDPMKFPGKYRLVDMKQIVLIGEDDKPYVTLYNELPAAFVTHAEGIRWETPGAGKGLEASVQVALGDFTALQKVEQTVEYRFIFAIPEAAKANKIRLRIDGETPIPLPDK